jgi:ABC-type antimicrobial peptide transport system permease subunit
MVLVDKKILGGGLAMLIVGIALISYLNSTVPIGQAGMTEEQAFDLMNRERIHKEYSTLAAILAGIGFLLVLISFGARRKKGGAKTIEKKPPEAS